MKACLKFRIVLLTVALCQLLFGLHPVLAEEDPESIHIHELIRQADSLSRARQLDTAIALGKLALRKAKTRCGEPDTSVASALLVLGRCYFYGANHSRCESLWNKALAMREKVLGPDHPKVAACLNDLAALYSTQGRYAEAEPLWKRAKAIGEKALGPDHLQVSRSLNGLAILHSKRGKYAQAESLYTRALAIREKTREPDHLLVSSTLNNLANCYRDQAKYARAEPLFRRALAIREKTLGPDHPRVAQSSNNLANLYLDQGKHTEARPLYKRALAINEKVLGPDHPAVASGLNNLASLYREQAKYAEAEPLFKRALTIREKALGPGHPLVAQTLNNLACLYRNQGRYGEAEVLHKRAVSMREKALGSFHPDVAQSLNNLAALYWDQAKYAEAEPLFKRALAIREKTLGPEHLDVANSLNNLGALYADQGKYAEAETLGRKALSIRERKLSSEHPDVCVSLGNLAVLYGSLGEREKSLKYYGRWRQSRQRFIDYVFSYASEDQKMRYTQQYPLISHSLLSFAITNESKSSRNAALELTLKTKALVIDAVSAEKQIAFCSYNDEIRKKAERHAQVCGEISTLVLTGAEKLDLEIYRDRLKVLHDAKDSLEVELSKTCAEFKDELATRRFTVTELAATLPQAGVLWEFVQYKPYDFVKVGSDEEKTGPPRYLAFTLDHAGNTTLSDLGEVNEIDSLVNLARKMIYSGRSEVYSPLAAEAEKRLNEVTGRLYEIIFAPLESHLSGRANIYVCPDGQLNLLPFEILHCPDGQYVIEKFGISYLSSGRDLLRFKKKQEPTDWALVLADPDFSLSQERLDRHRDETLKKSDVISFVHEPSRGASGCLNNRFDPLPHSREEAKSVGRTLEKKAKMNVDSYYGGDALEEILKGMSTPPRVLHLATHGYFCEDLNLAENRMLENPLLRSGLAFSGANRLMDVKRNDDPQAEDGILTAFEASGLNLVGTELVTLSACETGVGQVKNGEGVYGLRRAFQCAGARTIVMSLWKVPDKETCKLMDDFYENWLSGQTKKEALRQAALNILSNRRAKNKSTHPLFWGGFVLLGDPD
jgi:CHAT domain-containing protein/Tfp pilus assembly protein PilF